MAKVTKAENESIQLITKKAVDDFIALVSEFKTRYPEVRLHFDGSVLYLRTGNQQSNLGWINDLNGAKPNTHVSSFSSDVYGIREFIDEISKRVE